VQGVGDRVRRMAQAVALAQEDMVRGSQDSNSGARGAGSSSGPGGYGGGGGNGSGGGGGKGSGGGGGGTGGNHREFQALRKQQAALEAKNKELEETLKTQARRAAEQERKYAQSQKAAAAAKTEMMAAVERREHNTAAERGRQQTTTRSKTTTTAAARQTSAATKGGEAVRASFPGGVSPAKPKPSVTDEKLTFAPPPPRPVTAPPPPPPEGVPGAPRTLSEAAAELLGDTIIDQKLAAAEEKGLRYGLVEISTMLSKFPRVK